MSGALRVACASLGSIALLACGSAVFTGDGTSSDGGSADASSDSPTTDGARDAGLTGSDAASDASTKLIVFVTEVTTTGNFGGASPLIAADSICNGAAAGKLLGVFHAYLGVMPNYDASGNIAGSGPWFLPDGTTKIFPDRAAIESTGALAAINQNEKGQPIASGRTVWTGASSGGGSCNDWTDTTAGVTGEWGDTSNAASWKTAGGQACDTESSLYCFQQ